MRHARTVTLSREETSQLLQFARPGKNSLRRIERAKVVLLAAAGHTNEQIGAELGISRQTAARWRERFVLERLAGINADRPGRGRKSKISPEARRVVVEKTGQPTPAGHPRWSLRTMARATGLAVATVREIWRAHGLKPHIGRPRRGSPGLCEEGDGFLPAFVAAHECALVLRVWWWFRHSLPGPVKNCYVTIISARGGK